MYQGKLVPAIRTIQPLVVKVEDLRPRSDLTFKVFDTLTIIRHDLHHSLLNGCLIRNCEFRETVLSRCDLEQMQLIKCRFIKVDFRNVEMTSTEVVNCEFVDCTFDSIHIEECHWQDCTIERCSFKQAVLQDTKFEKCTLKGNDFRGASIQLNTFRSCKFENMVLGDCTFLGQIMLLCSYKNVRINTESIGSIFGITEEDLLSFELIYLGQDVVSVEQPEEIVASLETDYAQRHWFFMREVLRLNFGRSPKIIALEACLAAVLWPSTLGVQVKSADVCFLENIVTELRASNELPGLSVLNIPEGIKRHLENNSSLQRKQIGDEKLQRLSSKMREMMLAMVGELNRTVEFIVPSKKDKIITIKLTFHCKPHIDISLFLQQLVESSGMEACRPTKLMREETGSYIAFIQTTLVTLAALQIALWLINGCLHQVIELKSRVKIASQKNLPKVIRDRALLPEQNIPKWLTVGIQGIYAKLIANPDSLKQAAADFSRGNLQAIGVKAPPASSSSKTNRPAGKKKQS